MISDSRGYYLARGEMPRTSVVSAVTRNNSQALLKDREDGGGRLKPEGLFGAGGETRGGGLCLTWVTPEKRLPG